MKRTAIKIKVKTCPCGNEFYPVRFMQTECSSFCASKYSKQAKKESIKQCVICGIKINPYNTLQNTCGWKCDDIKQENKKTTKKSEKSHPSGHRVLTGKELEAEAVTIFNRYIRLRDTNIRNWGSCIVTLENIKYGSLEANAGHYYSADKFPNLRFNEDNVHLQSKSNNFYDMDAGTKYRANLINKIGHSAVNDLDRQAAEYKQGMHWKPDRAYYQNIIDHYTPLVSKFLNVR